MPDNELDMIFNPRSVAVVGATENPAMLASSYLQHFLNYGYQGKVYPINPRRPVIFGHQAYPDLSSVPGDIDYVIYCIGLDNAVQILEECHLKGVKAVQFFAGRGAETGRPADIEMEENILKAARQYGIRLIGPNCLGIYHPRIGLSNGWDFPRDSGTVGACLQSGGMSQLLVRFGALRGLRFSKVVSYGNALDLNECDFLDYFSDDQETRVIMCYLEGVKDGQRFFRTLRNAAQKKPVIILKGGRTEAGNQAAVSHTASLAGASEIWSALIKQAGAIMAADLEDWIDLGAGFSLIPPVRGNRVGITGGGGGDGVINADQCEEAGFKVVALPDSIRKTIQQKAPFLCDWVTNPVDMSIMIDSGISHVEVLRMMAEHPDFDFLIGQITEAAPVDRKDFTFRVMSEYETYTQIFKDHLKPIVVVLADGSPGISEIGHWRWQLLARMRTALVEDRIPFFPTIRRAARVIKELIRYYRLKAENRPCHGRL